VTKPIDPEELFSALLRWIKAGDRKAPVASKEATQQGAKQEPEIPQVAGVDSVAGLGRVGGYKFREAQDSLMDSWKS